MKKIVLITLCSLFAIASNARLAAQDGSNPKGSNQEKKEFTIEQIHLDPSFRAQTLRGLSWKDENSISYIANRKLVCKNIKTKRIDSLEIEKPIAIDGAENLIYSPKSKNLFAYTKENNLFIYKDNNEIAITNDSNKAIVNGQVVHRNEFGIVQGIFWSQDASKLAFYRMDQSDVMQYPLLYIDEQNESVDYTFYPEAGKSSHYVTIGVYDINKASCIFLQTTTPKDDYVPGVAFSPSGEEVYVTHLDRAQKNLKVAKYRASDGSFIADILHESNPIYVEPEYPVMFRPKHNDQFIWYSERSGFSHLYLYNTKGDLIKEITPSKEKWEVSSIVALSPDGKYVYFMGTKDSPLQQQLYCADIDKSSVRKITKTKGVHRCVMNQDGKYFIDIYSNTESQYTAQIIDRNGNIVLSLVKCGDPLSFYNKPTTEVFTIKSADGITDLYARMILPPSFDSTKQYPCIIYVYGGPHAQLITDGYLNGSGMFLQYLAQKGFVVFTLDNRGSMHRGFEFESAIHRKLGQAEVADQLKGVEFLHSLPFIDKDRIGVDGWSFGGFMTMSLKLRHSDLFKVAVAGGPVMNWEWYEVMYGERYMEKPSENPEGYEYANLLKLADKIEGKIMMIHGRVDGTVLPKHTYAFIQEAIKHKKQIDYFIYPNHEHNVLGKDRANLDRKIYEYFRDNLF